MKQFVFPPRKTSLSTVFLPLLIAGAFLTVCPPARAHQSKGTIGRTAGQTTGSGTGSAARQKSRGVPSAVVQREIEAAYAGIAQAERARDLKALVRYWAPDYTGREVDNKTIVSRAEAEKRMGEWFQEAYTTRIRHVIKKLSVSQSATGGLTATVIVNEKSSGYEGKPANVFSTDMTYRHTWVKTTQGWKIQTEQGGLDGK